jgi:osmoprotectant transport system permease protein
MEVAPRTGPIVVASKVFGESYVLAEMFAQLLEARGHQVDRRPGLGSTEVAFAALRAGAIDVYPEYTGTGLLVLLDEAPTGSPHATFARVASGFRNLWGLHWLPPLGFQNTYAIAVRPETADSLSLRTLSDLAREAPALVAGFTPDFIGREDGLPGLAEAYGLEPGEVRALLQAVKYEALAEGRVDVIDGYSTDGFIARYDLVVLEDDRSFFPSYEAAALVGQRMWNEQPRAVAVLTELSGRIDEEAMRAWNRRLEVDGEDVAAVAADALHNLGLLDRPEATVDPHDDAGLVAYAWARRVELAKLTLRHLWLVGISLVAAVLVAVPLGVVLERARSRAEGVIRGIGLIQTVPSIALLAFMIPLLGIGVFPAVVALFLYSLFPIVRNTFSGVRDADPVAVQAAEALGMTPGQVLRYVRLPLAAPIIMAGVRTAAVINVGTATLAAFIGAGGLGEPIVTGLSLADTRMILSGAIPAALLALLVDGLLTLAERGVRPGGIRAS